MTIEPDYYCSQCDWFIEPFCLIELTCPLCGGHLVAETEVLYDYDDPRER